MASHLPILLLLVLSALSTSAAWNVSIDCGATGSYTDGNSIEWMGDALIMQSGESKEVEHNYRPLRSLRVFSTGKRNCYTINATKGDHILVRASFYYGNYDNKSLAPSFELQFDGNFWTTVETQIDREVSHEAIYFVKGNAIRVCIAQTKPNQLPFISALEVRSLAVNMYAHANQNSALLLQRRFAFGTSAIVRHPYDTYDRIWHPLTSIRQPTITRKDQSIITNTSDYPPQTVLLGALTTPGPGFAFVFTFGGLPIDEVPIYMNMYFAEVDKAAVASPVQNRSFLILKDSVLLTSEPIIPSYENATELTIWNITASSTTEFSLAATLASTFPPIINALELFVVSDPLTEGTNCIDVEGLAALQRGFGILQEWSGDPCLPSNYKWDWLNCSTDMSPRVVALDLSGLGLSGPLPDFSSMDALQYIDLHNNSLNGTIPDFLGTLPNLKELNLAANNFSGLLPSSLSNNTNVNTKVTGNPNLCNSTESCKDIYSGSSSRYCKQRNKLQTIFAASISTLIISGALYWI